MRAFIFPLSSCQHDFRKLYYMAVEQRKFHAAQPLPGQPDTHKFCASFSKELQTVIYKTLRRHLKWDIYNDASIRNVLPKKDGWTCYPGNQTCLFCSDLPLARNRIGNFFGSLFRCFCPLYRAGARQWAARHCVQLARS